jgi:hypothetical protein
MFQRSYFRTPSNPPFIGRTQLRFFEPDTGNNPAGTGGTGDMDRQNLQGLLQRHNNDAMAVVATLLSENHSLRDERRTLRGQLPAQGAVVLSPEQATQWQAYQQLGALDVLQGALSERTTLQGQLAGLQREKLIGDVAAIGDGSRPWKASVLGQLPGADKLEFAIGETTKDGKQVKIVTVKDGDKQTPLADYASAHWADFLPALQAAPAVQQSGTNWPRQDAGNAPAPGGALDDYAKRFQDQRDKAHNPLAPAAPPRSPLG